MTCFLENRQQEPPPPYEIEPSWTYGINCDVRGTPVCIGNTLYATSGKGMYAFDADDGDLVLGEGHYCGVILGDGEETWSSFSVSKRFTLAEQETLLFVGDGGFDSGHGIYCLEPDSLQVLWHGHTDCPVWGSPAIANGKVVIGDNDGVVYCFVDDQQNGRILSPNGAISYLDYGGRSSSDVRDARAGIAGGRQVRVQPNPFSDRAKFKFALPAGSVGPVSLTVLDVAGRVVRSVTMSSTAVGSDGIEWDGSAADGSRLASGVYLYRLTAGQVSRSGRLILRP
jgi:hypothetical protein